MNHRIKDISGQRFGRLVAIEPAGKDKYRSLLWKCRCDCGNVVNIVGPYLRKGSTRSCGCLRKELAAKRKPKNRLSYGQSALNNLFASYQRKATERGLEFQLILKQFEIITQMPCYYCGSKPNQVWKMRRGHGEYIYNGIDRRDNSVGYVIGNVVPCCGTCNHAKHTMSQEQYTSHCMLVAQIHGDT